MKTICSLLLLLFVTSCTSQNKPGSGGDEPQAVSGGQSVVDTLPGDPTFIKSRDTVSTFGPHSITRNILQDRKGNYWLATWQGIIRYDGKLFTNFTLNEGLKHYHVFSVLEDKNGDLWFGTIGGGVYRNSGKAFTHYAMTDGLAGNIVMCMYEDKGGSIWFGTYGGISRFDGKTFVNFTVKDGLSSNDIFSIIMDRNEKFWIGTAGGVNCYESKDRSAGNVSFTSFTKSDGTPFINVRSVIEDKTGNIWIGGEDGLYRYDGKSVISVKAGFIGNILEDKWGNLWLSAGNTPEMVLYCYDGKTFTDILAKNGRQEPQVFGAMEDKVGNIWFGTVNGVCCYNGLFLSYFSDKVGRR